MSRTARVLVLATLLLAAGAPAAAADGLPVVGLDTTETGIESPTDGSRFYAIGEPGHTRVLKVMPEADRFGRTLRTRRLAGTLAVPGVAFDGTTAGISRDGRTLALIEPRTSFPRADTRLVLVDTRRMRKSETIDLDGDFSFDAISPDGGTIYLIHYLSRRDPTRYEVRAYDVAAARLLREPIIDRRLAPEVMYGLPVTRAVSADGAWAYTLYDPGNRALPFVHALDTERGVAFCIYLEPLQPFGNELSSMELAPAADGSALDVLARDGVTVASIATADWSVSVPSAEAIAAGEGFSSAAPYLAVCGLLAAGVGLFVAMRRRRRRCAPAEGDLPGDPFGPGREAAEDGSPASRERPRART